MATSVGYRHGDYPIAVCGTYVSRVQDFNLDRDLAVRTVYELGAAEAAGVDDAPNVYTGGLTWFPIDLTMERYFSEVTGTADVMLKSYMDATGVSVESLTKGVGGAKIVSLEYSCEAEGEYRGNVRFEATSWDTDGATTITAVTPTGDGAFRSPVVTVQCSAVTGVRVQGFRVRAGSRAARMYQMSSDDPVGIEFERPEVTAEITWYESTSMSGNTAMSLSSPQDIEIQVGSATWDQADNIKHTCHNMVSSGDGERGSVNGWATYTQRYISKGHSTSYGLTSNVCL